MREPSSGAQWLVVQIRYENTTETSRINIPSRPSVRYGRAEPDAAGIVLREFNANGTELQGIFADGESVEPNTTLEGAVAVEVPEEFDESLLEVVQTFTGADKSVTFVP